MPVGMWNEVLELAQDGGLDHRDALVILLDLGLQAQDEGRFKPRVVSVEHDLWERVDKAGLKGASEHESLIYLVDLGLQARAAQRLQEPIPEPTPPGVRVRVDLLRGDGSLYRLAEVYLEVVPVRGDLLGFGGHHYEVKQRAWSFGKGVQTAYLRVTRFTGEK
jgi:hypothetical protein